MPTRSPDPLALRAIRGARLALPPARPRLGKDLTADRAWVRTKRRPWAIDLFCGAGGLSLGLKESGFTVVAAADEDAVALETHAANIGGLTFHDDLADPGPFLDYLRVRGIDRVDVVAGGPPCQPFSRAGRAKIRDLVRTGVRQSTDDRIPLWTAFLAVLDVLRPKAVLLENVPDMAGFDGGAIVVSMLEALRSRGYEADARVLRAWEFGVPQHRERLFLVGTRAGFEWPRRRPRVTVRDAIGDLPEVPPGQRATRIPYEGSPISNFQRRLRQGMPLVDDRAVYDHCTREVRADDAEAFALMGEGATYRDVPARLRRYRVDIFDDKYKRLEWASVSRSITAHIAKDGYWYIHPDQDRTLSIREAARLQTFPDRFRFAGHPTVQLRQIGNAVPPALSRAVGHRLKAALQNGSGGAAPSAPVGDELRSWHRSHARDYPWRRERNPWLILVAEMCLRRTRADSVNSVYERVKTVAPTPEAVVGHPARVLKELEPLGLRWRSRNIVQVASELLKRHGGSVPRTESELRALTGVGDYVASAVRCFAFDQPSVLLDANTRRIVGRVAAVDASGAWTTRLEIFRWAGSAGANAAFNYALLDFGALVCKPRSPDCATCPIRNRCRSAESV